MSSNTGWRKFLTVIYWRIQLMRLLGGQVPLNIESTFEVEVDDAERIV